MDEQKAILFYDANEFCQEIINIIHAKGIMKKFKLVDVKSNDFLTNTYIRNIVKATPTLLSRDLNAPLVGAEIKVWLDQSLYFNLETNDIRITKARPVHEFAYDKDLMKQANAANVQAIALNGNDDELNRRIVRYSDIETLKITGNENKFVDSKITAETQANMYAKLKQHRASDIDAIINAKRKMY